jgi:hypothetical protein
MRLVRGSRGPGHADLRTFIDATPRADRSAGCWWGRKRGWGAMAAAAAGLPQLLTSCAAMLSPGGADVARVVWFHHRVAPLSRTEYITRWPLQARSSAAQPPSGPLDWPTCLVGTTLTPSAREAQGSKDTSSRATHASPDGDTTLTTTSTAAAARPGKQEAHQWPEYRLLQAVPAVRMPNLTRDPS